ncbi:hypothetical protein PFLUV_G00142240 [Perca fluviatilis]|uniref:Uncharacterized protein n=1 Tax=Perca fluviatilis TaxID=8168 RepID=A0A6A5F146_PERFL|nr:hypothetical protein PFLUV_G00142240 [Perca fluviatilis]
MKRATFGVKNHFTRRFQNLPACRLGTSTVLFCIPIAYGNVDALSAQHVDSDVTYPAPNSLKLSTSPQ